MGKNELVRIRKEYCNRDNNKARIFCTRDSALNIIDQLYNAIDFERPDFYSYDKGIVYLFEHFEFDASIRIDKAGSQYKKDVSIANKELDKEWELAKTQTISENIENLGVKTKIVQNKATKENWINNFTSSLMNHYAKLPSYKVNISSKLNSVNKIISIFVIEDATDLGVRYNIEHGNNFATEIWEYDLAQKQLKSCKDIDYFIFLSTYQKDITIIKKQNVKTLPTKNFSNSHICFFDNVNIISGCVTIPNKYLKNSDK